MALRRSLRSRRGGLCCVVSSTVCRRPPKSLMIESRQVLVTDASWIIIIITLNNACRAQQSLSRYRVSPVLPHDIQTTAAVFHLSPSARSSHLSLYSRQAGVSGFWCHRLERAAAPRRICAITRGFQTTTQNLSVFLFLPRHYHMTRV